MNVERTEYSFAIAFFNRDITQIVNFLNLKTVQTGRGFLSIQVPIVSEICHCSIGDDWYYLYKRVRYYKFVHRRRDRSQIAK